MTRKEEFNLRFVKYTRADGVKIHYCEAAKVGQPETFAIILSGYDKTYTKYLIEEIENAQAGQYFDDYHHPDSLTDDFGITIVPPNVVVSSHNYQTPLQVWKELMKEWMAFLQT